MIHVHVNGREEQVEEGLNVSGLLQHLGLADQRVAVELNREIVPRSQHSNQSLNEGDQVEIVRAIGGG